MKLRLRARKRRMEIESEPFKKPFEDNKEQLAQRQQKLSEQRRRQDTYEREHRSRPAMGAPP